uniref:Hint domain-containing protein n=1 Tax=Trichuris muris TaxID=70415 RepID=A0A5S6R0P1_TRIMR
MHAKEPAISALTFALTILHVVTAGYVDPAEFVTFHCRPNEVLSVYAKGRGYVKLSCTKPIACGSPTECKATSSEPACPQVNHFARGLLKLANGRISPVYCRIDDPHEMMTTETCEAYSVRPQDFDPDVSALSEAEALKTQAQQDDVIGSSEPIVKLFRLTKPSEGTEMVKTVRRTPSGYMVTACKVGCLNRKEPTNLQEVNIKDGNYLCDNCVLPPKTPPLVEDMTKRPNNDNDAIQKRTNPPPISQGDPSHGGGVPVFVYPGSYAAAKIKTASTDRAHATKRECGQCPDDVNVATLSQSNPRLHEGPSSRLAGGGCFSSDMQVNVGNKFKRMDQLSLGDHVLVDVNKMQRVDTMIHKNPSIDTDFVLLTTQFNRSLTLTPEHLIPLIPCNGQPYSLDHVERLASKWSRFASKATTNHCVIVLDGQAGIRLEKIAYVGRVRKRGVFSPLTSQGTLVVNDIFVSCFSALENHDLQVVFHKTANWMRKLMTKLANLFRREHSSKVGISWDSLYIEGLLRLAQWASSLGIV